MPRLNLLFMSKAKFKRSWTREVLQGVAGDRKRGFELVAQPILPASIIRQGLGG